MLCTAIAIATAWIALAALADQPVLRNDTGETLTVEEVRKITSIEGLPVSHRFFNPIPDGFSARVDAEWWRMQREVHDALAGKQHVLIQSGSRSQMVEVVRPGFGNITNDVFIIYFCGALFVLGAPYIFLRHATPASFLLALDFLSSAVSLFCVGAITLRYLSLPYEAQRILFGLSTTGILGFWVCAHFFLRFPHDKRFLARVPNYAVALTYGALLLQCLLIYLGVLPNISTFPISAVLNIVILVALLHSFATERDGFLKLQVGFLLSVVVGGFVILYALYAFAPLIGVAPLQPAHIALMFLIGLFAFGAVLENATLYKQKLHADERARLEKEHLRQEFHDNILNRLANIRLLSDAALRASTERDASVTEKVAAIKSEAGAYSRYARGLLWISDDQCSWNEFFSQLRQYGHDYVADHDLDFELSVDDAVLAYPAPLLVKACVYKIFVEALVNTIKHAQADIVRVAVTADESHLICRYADDGSGFDSDKVKPGHYGLLHVRRYAQEVHGTLTVDSTDAGTSLTLSIPLNPSAERLRA